MVSPVAYSLMQSSQLCQSINLLHCGMNSTRRTLSASLNADAITFPADWHTEYFGSWRSQAFTLLTSLSSLRREVVHSCVVACHCGFHFLLYTIDNVKKQSHNVHFYVFHQASWHSAFTHFMVFQFFIIMTCYFPRIVPPLVLHSHLHTKCWDDQRDPHGCSFNHCFTLYTIFSDMLHSRYAITIHLCQLAMNFISGNMFYPQNQNTLQTFSWHQVSSAVSIVHQLIQWTAFVWLTDSCISIACYPYYKCGLLPKNKVVVWQKHYRLEKVTYWPCLAC